MEVRKATGEDLPAIGRVLGAAFDDDPLINWIVRQDGRRAWAIETLFREVTRFAYLDHGESYLLADGSGAAVWRPPGVDAPSGQPLDAIFDEIVGPRGRAHSRLVRGAGGGEAPAISAALLPVRDRGRSLEAGRRRGLDADPRGAGPLRP